MARAKLACGAGNVRRGGELAEKSREDSLWVPGCWISGS